MESYHYLLDLVFILLGTKLFGLLTRRFGMPQVVGALVAGLILGPAGLSILQESDFITKISEVGVIVLMFCAGLEADVDQLKKSGKASFVIAILGVVFPIVFGYLIAMIFNRPGILESDVSSSLFLQNVFIGVILTATSVSITVETLKELGKLNSRAGNAILGAAIIDDILGIVALTIVTSLNNEGVSIAVVLLKIVGFFVFCGFVGFLFSYFFKKWTAKKDRDLRRFVIVAFSFGLLLAFCAERFFGVADITGAFIAGVIISGNEKTGYMARRLEIVSYLFLSPIFFASIGLKVVIPGMSGTLILFTVALAIVAVFTKIVGCGIGAKMCNYTNAEALQIGSGMLSRGEVALIVASKGAALGMLSTALFSPIIIVVIFTTIISPILLKIVYKEKVI